ncbi:MAG TPA: hypothetical protein PK156_31095, partial [Polyangium sp.]|nr:hypothetical protein [Polyangium sp.]
MFMQPQQDALITRLGLSGELTHLEEALTHRSFANEQRCEARGLAHTFGPAAPVRQAGQHVGRGQPLDAAVRRPLA